MIKEVTQNRLAALSIPITIGTLTFSYIVRRRALENIIMKTLVELKV
jgi:hypothetical protein